MSFPIKAWLRFYFKLVLISAWNGILRFGYVASGAAAVQLTQTVDIRTLGVKGALWILGGTIVASIGGALYKHQIPDPNEPTPPV
jgi:predicted membrane channel-forming protein YqfA (hemolysin III family)